MAILAGQLGLFARQDPALNGSLVAYLLDLKAVEAADVMEQAFKAGDVDEMVAGGWPRVRRELGLAGEQDKLIQVPGAPSAVYGWPNGQKPRAKLRLTPQSVVEDRLSQALRDTELSIDTAPKRKHHRKRK